MSLSGSIDNRSRGGSEGGSGRIFGLLDPAVLVKTFSHAPVGVGICDADGRFLAVNDALSRLLDRPREEIVGRPFLTFVHPAERAASLASYFVSVVTAIGQYPGRAAHAEVRCVTGRGADRWLAVTWTVTEPDSNATQYGIVHLNDVTERREVQRQLARAQQSFQLAFDCAPIGVAVLSADGRLQQVNRALGSMLGYEQPELAGEPIGMICQPGERRRVIETVSQMLTGRPDVQESVRRLRHRDGHSVAARCILAAARDPDGALSHLLIQIEPLGGTGRTAERLDVLQIRDPVTGLPTEQVMAAQLALTWGLPRSLVLVDVAYIPGLRGATGPGRDRVIARLAQILGRSCRDGDLLGRVSEREFAVIVEDGAASVAAAVAQRISEILARVFGRDDASTEPAVRIGVARDEAGTRSLEEMLLYARSVDGSSRAALVSPPVPAIAPSLSRLVALEADLGSALRRGELSVLYQPIVDLSDGSVHMAEALSRWHHPVLGEVPPDEFIPIAERSSTIHMLTAWVLRTACAHLAAWRLARVTSPSLAVAVNISPLSFAAADFPVMVLDTVQRAGLRARDLVLEITETAAADATTTLIDNAARLHDAGVRIAIDDFGAGYSSLARLVTLPITELKLDRTLTSPALDPAVSAALLRATVSLAADLGIELIAEGIETTVQLELLRLHACTLAQGNLLASPRPPHEVSANGFDCLYYRPG